MAREYLATRACQWRSAMSFQPPLDCTPLESVAIRCEDRIPQQVHCDRTQQVGKACFRDYRSRKRGIVGATPHCVRSTAFLRTPRNFSYAFRRIDNGKLPYEGCQSLLLLLPLLALRFSPPPLHPPSPRRASPSPLGGRLLCKQSISGLLCRSDPPHKRCRIGVVHWVWRGPQELTDCSVTPLL